MTSTFPESPSAATGTGIDFGLRETSFRDVNQSDGNGVGVFQIDLGKNPAVSSAQASDVSWAANWAAHYLDGNMMALAKAFPNLDSATLLAATVGSYNHGLIGEKVNLKNGWSPDTNTTHQNYASNVINLRDCFR